MSSEHKKDEQAMRSWEPAARRIQKPLNLARGEHHLDSDLCRGGRGHPAGSSRPVTASIVFR